MNRRLLLPAAIYVVILTLSSLPSSSFSGLPGGLDVVAHIVEYGALGLALRWALAGMRSRAAVTLTCVLLLAIADEALQSTTPGRQPSAVDVAIDLLAAGVAVLALDKAGERSQSTKRSSSDVV